MSLNFNNTKKILIAVDGSDYSIRAAEYGISVAKKIGAEILVVFVVDEVVLYQISKIIERETVERELNEDGKGYIKHVVSLAQKENVLSSSIITRGKPFERIVSLAKDSHVDMIVMGTYGRRGADRILMGSVAQGVIEYASCPVLVIK